MKKQILIDTTYERTDDDYREYCEMNDIDFTREEYDDWNCREMELDVDDFFDNIKYSDFNIPCIVEGSLGLWNGVKEIEPKFFETLSDAINACVRGCNDYIVTKPKRGSYIQVEGMHHDGTNNFIIYILSDSGLDKYRRNGKVSLRNRENILTLPDYLY